MGQNRDNESIKWDHTHCLNEYLHLKNFLKETNLEKPRRKSSVWAQFNNLMLFWATNCYNNLVGLPQSLYTFPNDFKSYAYYLNSN